MINQKPFLVDQEAFEHLREIAETLYSLRLDLNEYIQVLRHIGDVSTEGLPETLTRMTAACLTGVEDELNGCILSLQKHFEPNQTAISEKHQRE